MKTIYLLLYLLPVAVSAQTTSPGILLQSVHSFFSIAASHNANARIEVTLKKDFSTNSKADFADQLGYLDFSKTVVNAFESGNRNQTRARTGVVPPRCPPAQEYCEKYRRCVAKMTCPRCINITCQPGYTCINGECIKILTITKP